MLGEKTKHARSLKLTSREEKFPISFAIGLCFMHALPLVKSTCFSRRHSCFFDGVLYTENKLVQKNQFYVYVRIFWIEEVRLERTCSKITRNRKKCADKLLSPIFVKNVCCVCPAAAVSVVVPTPCGAKINFLPGLVLFL